MWIEFDNQLVNLDLCRRIRITEQSGTDLEAPRRFVEIEIKSDEISETFIFEEYYTKEQAQERYEEIKFLLTGKPDKWYFAKVNDEDEGIITCKFPTKKERNKWLKDMEIIQIWEQEVPLQW